MFRQSKIEIRIDMRYNTSTNSSVLTNHTHVRVRYADIDKMGIVYNSNYLRFFEIGRTELIRALGMSYLEMENKGFILPLVIAHVEFHKPAFYDNLLIIETQLDATRISATIQFDYFIYREDELLASGYTIHSFSKKEILKPIRPPKFFLEFIENKVLTSSKIK